MLAFILGEIIAVYKRNVFIILLILPCILVVQIITKLQVSVFVMIFLSVFIGFVDTEYAVKQRDEIYKIAEQKVEVAGKIYKIQSIRNGFHIYLKNVEIKPYKRRESVEDIYKKGEQQVYKAERFLIYSEDIANIKIGNQLLVRGKFSQFDVARNPGNFDSKRYYMSLGIFGKVDAQEIRILNKEYSFVRHQLYLLKIKIANQLEEICGNNHHGISRVLNNKWEIYSAMLLGDKTNIDAETKELYSVSGIAHILSISGLHITFVGMFAYSILRKKFRFIPSSVVSISIVMSFCIITGMGIATIRAAVMFFLKLLGEVLGKRYDYLTAISIAGIILLKSNPFVLFHSGFQMSFAAIIAITFVWSKILIILNIKEKNESAVDKQIRNKKDRFVKRLGKTVRGIMKKIFCSLLLGITISFVMNPIIAYNYYQLPTYSCILNIVVVCLMSVVIASGVAGIIFSFISIFFGKVFIFPGCIVLQIYTFLCNTVARIPYNNVIVGKPSLIKIFVYYLILILFIFAGYRFRRKKAEEDSEEYSKIPEYGIVIEKENRNKKLDRIIVLCTIVLCVSLNFIIYNNRQKSFAVTFIDVGQGDGIFMHYKDMNILVDGGSSSENNVGKNRIIPFLKAQCVRKIDYAFITHSDSDHTNGIIEMIEKSNHNGIVIRNLVLPDISAKDNAYIRLEMMAKEHGINILYVTKGNTILFGELKLECLYPSKDTIANDKNDYSTVLSVTYKNFSMLLTGDISTVPENEIIAKGKNMNKTQKPYTILKVAHHGSKYSTSDTFLEWAAPRYGIISVGKNNSYGHPSEEILKKLMKKCIVLRTDQCGAITVRDSGGNMTIEKTLK